MATGAKLQAEPASDYLPGICPVCDGQGRVLYPFPGNCTDHPLGGVKITCVTCLKCNGSGQTNLSAPGIETISQRQ